VTSLGTIKGNWKQIQENKWYNPVFEDFINRCDIPLLEKMHQRRVLKDSD
jgi:hypothetical protein